MIELYEKYLIIRDFIRAYQDGTLTHYIAALVFMIVIGVVLRLVFGTRVLGKISDYLIYAMFFLLGGLFIYIGIVAIRVGGTYYQDGIPLILLLGIVLLLFPLYWSFLRRLFGKISSFTDIKGGKKDRED